MPKMKTRRGAAKRLRVTGSGKVRRFRAGASHLMTSKNTKQKRRLRRGTLVNRADEKKMLKQLAKA